MSKMELKDFPKVQCVECKDILQSSYAGEYVACGCGKSFIDTDHYMSRFGGDVEPV